jgi:hypothetical protein
MSAQGTVMFLNMVDAAPAFIFSRPGNSSGTDKNALGSGCGFLGPERLPNELECVQDLPECGPELLGPVPRRDEGEEIGARAVDEEDVLVDDDTAARFLALGEDG